MTTFVFTLISAHIANNLTPQTTSLFINDITPKGNVSSTNLRPISQKRSTQHIIWDNGLIFIGRENKSEKYGAFVKSNTDKICNSDL